MTVWILIGLLVVGAIAAVAAGDGGTLGGLDAGTIAALTASLALLVFFLGGIRSGTLRGIGTAARHLLIWVALILALVAGYGYREEIMGVVRRVTGELAPPGTALSVAGTNGQAAVRLRKRADGHFVARVQVNGATVGMLVDTGASTVVLRPADAQAAGFDPARLSYSIPVATANGRTFAAAVRIETMAIGPIVMRDIEALVTRPGALGESLLGMEFLRRLRSYEAQGDYLTLRS